MSLSLFQILKSGTSCKQAKQDKLEQKQEEKTQMIEEKYKFRDEDSESDNINLQKEYKKKINQKKQIQKLKKNQYLLKINNIKINIENPKILTNFTKILKFTKLPTQIKSNLHLLNYQQPTPVQKIVIPQFVQHKNILALSATGSGKTLSYILPLITQLQNTKDTGLKAIIFAPTQELAEQIYRVFILINKDANNLVIKNINNISNEYNKFDQQIQNIDVLISTPLKFIKYVKFSNCKLEKLQNIIFDEIDRYFELNMEKQLQQIFYLLKSQTKISFEKENYNQLQLNNQQYFFDKQIQLTFFSATISYNVEQLLKQLDYVKIIVGEKNHAINHIEQNLVYTLSEQGKLDYLKNLINEGGYTPPVLIFVQSKERANQLYEELIKAMQIIDLRIAMVHNNIDSKERENTILSFRKGKLWGLITTDLMARGIDLQVQLVINYDFPTSIVNYIHRVGRTGRANQGGKAITLYTNVDRNMLKSIGNLLKASGCKVEDWMLELNQINKQKKKHLEKFPVKRDLINQDKIQKLDKKDNSYWGNFKKAVRKSLK